jgi:cytoskeletal protein CcmA (bactofilin family)
MQVDGYVEGKISSEKTLIISAVGRIKGEVTADKVIINGLFDGQIFANTVEILPQGKVQGTIHTKDLCIERGGSFIGEMLPATEDKVINLSKIEQKNPLKTSGNSENRIENKA